MRFLPVIGYRLLVMGLGIILLLLSLSCHKKSSTGPDNGDEDQRQYDPRNISRTDSTDSYGPSIAIGPDGTIYIAWMDGGVGEYEPSDIYFRYKTPEGEWSEAENISNTSTDSWDPHLAVDPYNNLHMVWEEYSDHWQVYYRWRSSEGKWSQVELLISGGDQPRIGVDKNGNVHVICIDFGSTYNIGYTIRSSGGSWSTSIALEPQGTNPNMVVDALDNVHIVYENPGHDIEYLQRSSTGTWLDAVKISNTQGTGKYAMWPQINVDTNNNPWIIWAEAEYWEALSFTPYWSIKTDTGWSQPDTLAFKGLVASKAICFSAGKPMYIFEAGSTIHIYIKNEQTWELFTSLAIEGGESNDLKTTVDSQGKVHIVWSGAESNELGSLDHYEIYYEVINP